MKPEKKKYVCQVNGCEFESRARNPRCTKCLSRMVKECQSAKGNANGTM